MAVPIAQQILRAVFGGGADVSAANPLPTTPAASVAVPNRSSWGHGQKTVTAHGTAEQLASVSVPDGFALAVRALPGNTGNIYLGDSKANAEDADERITFAAGLGLTLMINNANLIWVDSAVDGEGVDYWVET